MDVVPADDARDEDGITLDSIRAARAVWSQEHARLSIEAQQALGRVQACDYMLAQAARVARAAVPSEA